MIQQFQSWVFTQEMETCSIQNIVHKCLNVLLIQMEIKNGKQPTYPLTNKWLNIKCGTFSAMEYYLQWNTICNKKK